MLLSSHIADTKLVIVHLDWIDASRCYHYISAESVRFCCISVFMAISASTLASAKSSWQERVLGPSLDDQQANLT